MYLEKDPFTTQQLPLPPFNVNARYATFGTLFNVSYWLWRFNPSVTVPAMLSSAVDVVKQSAVIAVFVVAISQLASVGILGQLADAIASNDFIKLLKIASSSQLIPSVVWAISIAVGFYYIISVLGGGFVYSAEYGSYLQLIRTGRISISDVIENSGRGWHEMAWTVMITEALKYGPLVVILIWIVSNGIVKMIFGFGSNLFPDILLWIALLAIVGIFTLILSVLTLYSYPAAANGRYGLSAIKESVRLCRMFPDKTILYSLLRASSLIAIVVISYFASQFSVQISSVFVALVSFMVVPVLHTLKTAIYLRGESQQVIIPLPVGPSIIQDAPRHVLRISIEKARIGLQELAIFLSIPSNLAYHLLSAATFAAGILAGNRLSSSGLGQLIYALGYKPGSVNSSFKGFALPFLALDISFHNWQVSLATALSGLALVLPILITMMFNGFILGLLGSLVPNLMMFLVAILPHGIIELPSFILSGSVGLSLAIKFVNALREGRASSRTEIHRAIRQTIYVVLGLIPFFIFAGIVEALVTPFIMRFYGWK
ncbi:MAG: stage II sporulation protein M [Thermoproteota archaeon]